MNEFFTWQALSTYAGACLATYMITELIKDISFFKNISARIVSYIIAFLLLMFSYAFTTGLNFEVVALCLVNAFVVAFASNGAFDALTVLKEKGN